MALSAPNKPSPSVVITIVGPAGAGESTVAKLLAKKLHYAYLDTGAMYRALTLKALREKIPLEDEGALEALARRTQIDLRTDESSALKVILDGEDVTAAIRSLDVTNNTFYVAGAPKVRTIMVEKQREIGGRQNVVVEGRDIGTVVFPQAAHKFYLDADFEERCQRRILELKTPGGHVDEDKLKKELRQRDRRDMTRSAGPLKKAEDAVLIDSTHLTVDAVVEEILRHIARHGQKVHP